MQKKSVREAHDAYLRTKRFGSLDGIRCISIVLVLWHHSPANLPEYNYPMLLHRGFTGVDFFFVLSGYLITTLLLREEDRNGRISLLGFYWRRALRIIPIYFLMVTLAAVWWIGFRGQEFWWGHLPYFYAFLANFLNEKMPLLGQMWSLAVEEQYYLVWPAALLLLPTHALFRMILLAALIVFCVLISQGVLPKIEMIPPTERATFYLPTTPYSAILIGSFTGVALHWQPSFGAIWRVLRHPLSPTALFIALILAWQFLPEILRGWPDFVMHMLMAASIASVVVRENHSMARVLGNASIARIGAISYGIYVWHFVGLHFGNQATESLGFAGALGHWTATILFVAASIIIAEISFRYFESYFLRLRYRYKGRSFNVSH